MIYGQKIFEQMDLNDQENMTTTISESSDPSNRKNPADFTTSES